MLLLEGFYVCLGLDHYSDGNILLSINAFAWTSCLLEGLFWIRSNNLRDTVVQLSLSINWHCNYVTWHWHCISIQTVCNETPTVKRKRLLNKNYYNPCILSVYHENTMHHSQSHLSVITQSVVNHFSLSLVKLNIR